MISIAPLDARVGDGLDCVHMWDIHMWISELSGLFGGERNSMDIVAKVFFILVVQSIRFQM